jgi:hypothetical protein
VSKHNALLKTQSEVKLLGAGKCWTNELVQRYLRLIADELREKITIITVSCVLDRTALNQEHFLRVNAIQNRIAEERKQVKPGYKARIENLEKRLRIAEQCDQLKTNTVQIVKLCSKYRIDISEMAAAVESDVTVLRSLESIVVDEGLSIEYCQLCKYPLPLIARPVVPTVKVKYSLRIKLLIWF